MNYFYMNGRLWRVVRVAPNAKELVDRTNKRTVATTDPRTSMVYISSEIYGSFFNRVLIHELGHCALISFGLLDDIHRMARPQYWVEAEEWVCNFIADYGLYIFQAAYSVLGDEAITRVPYELERIIA